jgi:hypothetical protein
MVVKATQNPLILRPVLVLDDSHDNALQMILPCDTTTTAAKA